MRPTAPPGLIRVQETSKSLPGKANATTALAKKAIFIFIFSRHLSLLLQLYFRYKAIAIDIESGSTGFVPVPEGCLAWGLLRRVYLHSSGCQLQRQPISFSHACAATDVWLCRHTVRTPTASHAMTQFFSGLLWDKTSAKCFLEKNVYIFV